MKHSARFTPLFFLFSLTIFTAQLYAQANYDPDKTYLVIKNDGARYIGNIISENAQEVIIKTENLGEVAIPKHEIKEIRELNENEVDRNGQIIEESKFASRYYLSSSAYPLRKGNNFIIWNLYGPDVQFGISDNISMGITTTWVGVPIFGSAKYSFLKDKNIGFSVGAMLGTGSWAAPEFGLAVPFGTVTFGQYERNLSLSVGHGFYYDDETDSDQATFFSVAGTTRISNRVSLVLDSFIFAELDNEVLGALIIPSVRLHSGPGKAFQFGFAGVAAEGELLPVPVPFLQWFRAF